MTAIQARQRPGPKPRTHCIVCSAKMTKSVVKGTPKSHCDECRKLRQRCRRVGITIQEYHEVFLRQGGLCACCQVNPATVLDHNHTTGQFRGILCNNCNLLIGWLETLPLGSLERVENYLGY